MAEATPTPRLKAGSKRADVLRVLIERGERGLNRFEAEQACHDHVLPSTVSELCAHFGLEIPRTLETVRGHRGKDTECSRYRLTALDVLKARRLLEGDAGQVADDERWQRIAEAERRARGVTA